MKYRHRLSNFVIEREMLIETIECFNQEERNAFFEIIMKRYLYGGCKDWPEDNLESLLSVFDKYSKDMAEKFIETWGLSLQRSERYKYLKKYGYDEEE